MQIYISKNNSKLSNSEIRHAMRWYGSALLGNKLSKHIIITVKFIDIKNNDGIIDVSEGPKSREFIIELSDRYSRNTLRQVIAHEMVHLKQYARGELKNIDGRTTGWNKKKYRVNIRPTKEEYYNYPWEIEAYGRELVLYYCYKFALQIEGMK